MNELLIHRTKPAFLPKIKNWRQMTHTACDGKCQINLLSVLTLFALIIGLVAGTFNSLDPLMKTTLTIAVIALIAVPIINHKDKQELAAMVFYLSLVLISLVTFLVFDGRPIETVLTYFYLLSLILFLLPTLATRIIGLFIVLIRITLYTLKLNDADGDIYLPQPPPTHAHMAYVAIVLGFIVLTFALYGWKLYITEAKGEQKEIFAQHMSHDLHASFQSVASTISLLEYRLRNNNNIDPILVHEAYENTQFHSYILKNFTDFSRANAAPLDWISSGPIDIASELEKLTELHRIIADQKGVRIQLDVDDNFPAIIYADQVKIIRIVLNLLLNAINHTIPEELIEIKASWMNSQWKLTVSNDKTPIDEEEIERIFDAANRAKRHDQKRLGLGLSITKFLVDTLGGTISISNEGGKMTIVTVLLPNK